MNLKWAIYYEIKHIYYKLHLPVATISCGWLCRETVKFPSMID